MDAHFASLDLKSQPEKSDNELLDYYNKHFPVDQLTQTDVENVLRAICDCMARGPTFWPKRDSPGYYCVLRTIVHIRDAIEDHDEWLANLRPAAWSAYCACFDHGASGFTTEVWSNLQKTFKDMNFDEEPYAKQLLKTIRQTKNVAIGEERHLTASHMRNQTISMLETFSNDVALNCTAEIQALYLDYASHGGPEYDDIRQYWSSALVCLERKLEGSKSAPLSLSLVHFYAKDEVFMRRLVEVLEAIAGSELSEDAASRLDRVIRNFSSALCDTKDADFKYLYDDAQRTCLKLMSNPKMIKSACYMLRQLSQLGISKKYTLADAPSVKKLVTGETNTDFLMKVSDKTESDKDPIKEAQGEVFQRLLPELCVTVEDMALCMPLYVKLLNVSTIQFVKAVDKMYFDTDRLKIVQLNAAKFHSAFLLFVDESTKALTKLDAFVPDEKKGNPISHEPVENLSSALKDMVEKLYKSPGKKMIADKATQSKLFEIMQLMVSTRSLCLLSAIRGFDKEIFNWPVLRDRFQDNLKMLEAFLADNFTSIESVHFGIGFAVIALDFVTFMIKNAPQAVCNSQESIRRIVEICLERDIMVITMNGSEQISIEGLVLIILLRDLMSAANVQTMLPINKQLYPLYVRMSRKTCELQDSATTAIMVGLTNCLGSTQDTVFQFLQHFPLLLEFIQELKDSDSPMFLSLLPELIQRLQQSSKSGVPDELARLVERLITIAKGVESIQVQMVQFVSNVCKQNRGHCPELMRDYLLSFLQEEQYAATALMGLASLAENQPQVMTGALDHLVEAAKSNIKIVAPVIMTMEKGQFETPKLMAAICEVVNHHLAQDSAPNKLADCLTLMQRIGVNNPQLLAERESDIKRWKSSPGLLEACNHLLDVIANDIPQDASKDASDDSGRRSALSDKKREKLAKVQSAADQSKTCELL